MNKKQLIGKYKNLEGVWDAEGAELARRIFLQDLEQLDEPQKPVVPQFVADIIEYYKGQNATLYDGFTEKNFNKQYNEWLMNEQDAYDKVALAWIFGYEVEKEKRYTVKIKAVNQYLVKNPDEEFLGFLQSRLKSKFTRKELEDAGVGWVFDCEGIEIEEAE